MGPWSLGYHCFGVEPFLLMTLDDPEKTKLCLDRMKEATVQFGIAQAEAGADAITLPDHATGDLVSGEYYDRFLKDLHTELAARIPIPIILHICGRTVDRMGFIVQTGMAAFHYDSKNEPAESVAAIDNRIALVGNINNPETLFSKGPDIVRIRCSSIVTEYGRCASENVVSSLCTFCFVTAALMWSVTMTVSGVPCPTVCTYVGSVGSYGVKPSAINRA